MYWLLLNRIMQWISINFYPTMQSEDEEEDEETGGPKKKMKLSNNGKADKKK